MNNKDCKIPYIVCGFYSCPNEHRNLISYLLHSSSLQLCLFLEINPFRYNFVLSSNNTYPLLSFNYTYHVVSSNCTYPMGYFFFTNFQEVTFARNVLMRRKLLTYSGTTQSLEKISNPIPSHPFSAHEQPFWKIGLKSW